MWRKAAYRTASKLSDLRHPITTKSGWEFEHVGIDIQNYIEISVSIHKDEWANTDKDQQKLLNQTSSYGVDALRTQIFGLAKPTKSVGIFLDGSLPLWCIRSFRRGKKSYKLQHSPGSELLVATECKLASDMKRRLREQNRSVGEMVLSGTRTPGSLEGKMAGWFQDLVARGSVRNERIAIIAQGAHHFATMMAMVPFHNISFLSLVQQNSSQFYFYDMMEYFGLLEYMDSPDLSRIRIDLTFLIILTYGISWAQLNALSNVSLKDILDNYHQISIPKRKFLFTESLKLDVKNFKLILPSSKVQRRSMADNVLIVCKEYTEMSLQTHHTLCTGRVLNYYYVPTEYLNSEKPLALGLQHITAWLDGVDQPYITPTVDLRPAISALHFGISCIGSEFAGSCTTLGKWMKAHPEPKEAYGVFKQLISQSEIPDVLTKANDLIQTLKQQIPPILQETHRAKVYSRIYHHTRASATSDSCRHEFDIGALSQSKKGLRYVPQTVPIVFDPLLRRQVKLLVEYDPFQKVWAMKNSTHALSLSTQTHLSSLRFITWNVLFNKYNNEDTVMGKPAIDRCSSQRYVAIAHELSQRKADVIALQEVMPEFWEYLANQTWVRENYILTCDKSGTDINPWGIFMMCHKRLTIAETNTHNVPGYNGHICPMPEVAISIKGVGPEGILRISSIHLNSSLNENMISVRKTQIANFMKLCDEKRTGMHCIVGGDYNQEWSMPSNTYFRDAWTTAGLSERSGWTIDNERNGLCARLIEDQFQGRYDRIFFRSPVLHLEGASLIGDRSVNEILGSPPSSLAPNMTWPEWLYPSDHFGVECSFCINFPRAGKFKKE